MAHYPPQIFAGVPSGTLCPISPHPHTPHFTVLFVNTTRRDRHLLQGPQSSKRDTVLVGVRSLVPVLVRRRVRPTGSKRAPPDDDPESWRQIGADEDADRTFVFVAYRRPELIAWHASGTDKELMEGMGPEHSIQKVGRYV